MKSDLFAGKEPGEIVLVDDINSVRGYVTPKKLPEHLADEHWQWLSGFIRSAFGDDIEELPIDAVEYLYKTAFVHGYKHAKEG